MHLSQVDLNLFVVLEAIYREGNITRAGQQLNLTQPAISHALKRLRDLLQDPLFVRRGAHMMPTPFTRNMIEEVRQALQILETNLGQSHSFVPEHTRRSFHFSMWEYLETLLLPPLLVRLSHAAPGMSITTSRVKRRDLETELASGSLDLAIEIPMTVSDRIRQKWLLNEPYVVMARQGHPAIAGGLDLNTYLMTGYPIGIGQRESMGNPCMNNYAAADGRRFWIVGLEPDRHWPALCRAVGRADWLTDPRFSSARSRAINAVELIAELDEIFATKPLDGWAEVFATEPDFFWSPINTLEDVVSDEQFHAAGGIVDVPDGPATVPMVATPADFHGTPPAPRSVAPRLGEHTEEVLAELNARRTS